MSENVELTAETVVTCPHCRQQNRLFKQAHSGIYQCSDCQTQLADPFTSLPAASPRKGSRGLSWFISLVIVFCTSFGINLFVRSLSEDRSVQTLSSVPTPLLTPSPELVLSTSVPSPIPSLQNRSLPSNKVLVSPDAAGHGLLKVSNGTVRDAYVKLVDPASRKLIAAFYVKANSDFELGQIPDGTYEALFVEGEDWDGKTKSFTRSGSFAKFDKSLNFVTKQQTDGFQYTIIELTLNPIAGGNVPLNGVDEQEFSQY